MRTWIRRLLHARRSVICTVGSDTQCRGMGPLPARELYASARFASVAAEARRLGNPFFALSGAYGFVDANQLIAPYDHWLRTDEVAVMTWMVEEQLRQHDIGAIRFYVVRGDWRWSTYLAVLTEASRRVRVTLRVRPVRAQA